MMIPKEEIEKIIRKRKFNPQMSNSKWHKLFKCIGNYRIEVVGMAKMINGEKEIPSLLSPMVENLDYYSTSIEKFGGHFAYSQIEYLRIPREIENSRHGVKMRSSQDIDNLILYIEGIGKLDKNISKDGIIIYAYGGVV